MFLEPFLLMLLLVTLVMLVTPLTTVSLVFPKKTKESVNYSHKHFSDYPSGKCKNSFFIHPTNKDEIAEIISSPDENKSVGPYSLTNNILILLKNEIYNPLAGLFSLSFSSGIFPSVLKIAKVVPLYKKDSKLDYQNYHLISLLSNIEKILEKLMYEHLCKFLNYSNIQPMH